MNPAGTKLLWPLAGAVCWLLASPAQAQDPAATPDLPADGTRPTATMRPGSSPVETFRKLLAMSPAERDEFLSRYPAATRDRLLEKAHEYQLLPNYLRELRLQVTELRWYLLPLMKMPAAIRAERLKLVPESCRELVSARLEQWNILPPALKDEILEYETTLHYFVGRNAGGVPAVQRQRMDGDVPERQRPALEHNLARWQALSKDEQEQTYASFETYFQLSEAEKQKTLDTLSEPVRQETEKVLGPIEKWPRSQRQQYLVAFRKFADMPPREREWFIRNAGRWQKMSAAERQACRDLVQQLPELPIMPPDLIRPRPQPTGSSLPFSLRTNPTAAPLK
jgi:hypothetical protein